MKDQTELLYPREELLSDLSDVASHALPAHLHDAIKVARLQLAVKPDRSWPSGDDEFASSDIEDLEADAVFEKAFPNHRHEADVMEVAGLFDIERATVRDLLRSGWTFTVWPDGTLRFEKERD